MTDDDPRRIGVPDVDADAVRADDQAAGLPPALDVDPGPALDVTVTALHDRAGDVLGWLVEGTKDEALARRLIDKERADGYGGHYAPGEATADTFRWWTPTPDADAQLVSIGELSHQFDGLRFTVTE